MGGLPAQPRRIPLRVRKSDLPGMYVLGICLTWRADDVSLVRYQIAFTSAAASSPITPPTDAIALRRVSFPTRRRSHIVRAVNSWPQTLRRILRADSFLAWKRGNTVENRKETASHAGRGPAAAFRGSAPWTPKESKISVQSELIKFRVAAADKKIDLRCSREGRHDGFGIVAARRSRRRLQDGSHRALCYRIWC